MLTCGTEVDISIACDRLASVIAVAVAVSIASAIAVASTTAVTSAVSCRGLFSSGKLGDCGQWSVASVSRWVFTVLTCSMVDVYVMRSTCITSAIAVSVVTAIVGTIATAIATAQPSRAAVCSHLGKLADCGSWIAASRRSTHTLSVGAAKWLCSRHHWSLLNFTTQPKMGSAQWHKCPRC